MDQVKEELPPTVMLDGVAVREQVGKAAKTSSAPTKKVPKIKKMKRIIVFNVFFLIILSLINTTLLKKMQGLVKLT